MQRSANRDHTDNQRSGDSISFAAETIADRTPLLAVCAVVALLSFQSGGTFGSAVGLGVVILLLAGLIRVALAHSAGPGFGRGAALAVLAFAALVLWTGVSGTWSDAQGRALVEANRTLLYMCVFALMAGWGWTSARLHGLLAGLFAVTAAVTVIGLVTWLLPDVFEVDPGPNPGLPAYPLSYWNALGAVGVTAALLGMHHACTARPAWLRTAAALSVPACVAVVVLSQSRGAMAALGAMALLYVVLGRPRRAEALLALTPAAAGAIYFTTRDGLGDPGVALAPAAGHDLALELALCCLAAGLLSLGASLIGRSRAHEGPARNRAPAVLAIGVAAAVAVAGAVALTSGRVGAELDEFGTADSDASRLAYWRAATSQWEESPVRGGGAGTWEFAWERTRDSPQDRFDAHSLYLEMLGELGLVGLVLLAVVLVVGLLGLVRRVRTEDRPAVVAGLVIVLAWAAQAGVDFLWEVTAVGIPAFALLGLAAGRSGGAPRTRTSYLKRAPVALVLIAVAILPTRVAVSQQRLDAARTALERGDCDRVRTQSRAALDQFPQRAEAWDLIAVCEIADSNGPSAVSAAQRATDAEPDNWQHHYLLALARASAGNDPLPALQAARIRNPLEPLLLEALESAAALDRSRRPSWSRRQVIPLA